MSLALRIDCDNRARELGQRIAVIIFSMLSIGLAVWSSRDHIVASRLLVPALALFLLACVGAIWHAARYARARGARGVFEVDSFGRAYWTPHGRFETLPVRVERWQSSEIGAWIRVVPKSETTACPIDLTIGRRRCAEGQWQGLRRWLQWLDR